MGGAGFSKRFLRQAVTDFDGNMDKFLKKLEKNPEKFRDQWRRDREREAKKNENAADAGMPLAPCTTEHLMRSLEDLRYWTVDIVTHKDERAFVSGLGEADCARAFRRSSAGFLPEWCGRPGEN